MPCDALEFEDLCTCAEDSNKEPSAAKLERATNIADVGSTILSASRSLRACSDSAELFERAWMPTFIDIFGSGEEVAESGALECFL